MYFFTLVALITGMLSAVPPGATFTAADLYDLANPSETVYLDNEIIEVSGLTIYQGRFFAIQDEKGKIYEINPITGYVMRDDKFWKDGDFEDIAVVGEYFYAMKSNGNLYKTPVQAPDEDKTEKIDLGFDDSWNFEGLAYDSRTNSLLMAAKRKKSSVEKEIFSIDIDNPAAIRDPIYIVNQEETKAALKQGRKSWTAKLAHELTAVSYSFNPSALAIHPRNGRIFILSSPNAQLLILNDNWKFRAIIELDQVLFNQPESICFDEAANLYIANEGGSGKATLLKFVPQ